MAVNADERCGKISLGLLLCSLLYYTLWVIVVPFVDRDHYFQQYFPPREYAILMVVLVIVVGLVVLTAFIGLVMFHHGRQQNKKILQAINGIDNDDNDDEKEYSDDEYSDDDEEYSDDDDEYSDDDDDDDVVSPSYENDEFEYHDPHRIDGDESGH